MRSGCPSVRALVKPVDHQYLTLGRHATESTYPAAGQDPVVPSATHVDPRVPHSLPAAQRDMTIAATSSTGLPSTVRKTRPPREQLQPAGTRPAALNGSPKLGRNWPWELRRRAWHLTPAGDWSPAKQRKDQNPWLPSDP